MNSLHEIWLFIRKRKKYWLIPLIFLLILFGLIIILAGNSAIAPFIYTLF